MPAFFERGGFSMTKPLPKQHGTYSAAVKWRSALLLLLGLEVACGAHTVTPQSRPTEGVSSPANPTPPPSKWCVAEPLRSTEASRGVTAPLADLNTQFL